MATGPTPRAPTAGGFDLNSLLSLLGGVNGMMGSGKETSTASMGPEATGMLQQLSQQIGATGAGDAIDGVIQNIFNQAKGAIGAPAFTQAGAGAYKGSSAAQAAMDPFAKAVAAASGAKLTAQQNAQGLQAELFKTLASSNRTTTRQTGATGLGKILPGALTGLSIYGKLRGKGVGDSLPKGIGYDPLGDPQDLQAALSATNSNDAEFLQNMMESLGGGEGVAGVAGVAGEAARASLAVSADAGEAALSALGSSGGGGFADWVSGAPSYGAETLTNAGEWAGGADLFAETGASTALDFAFPGAGLLLGAVLQGGNPIDNVGNTIAGFFDELFG